MTAIVGHEDTRSIHGTTPCLTANCTSSALLFTPSCSIIRHLWNATVLGATSRIAAAFFHRSSLGEQPGISRCRAVRSCRAASLIDERATPMSGGCSSVPSAPHGSPVSTRWRQSSFST